MDSLLEIRNLKVSFFPAAGQVHAVRGVSLHVGRGESVGVVGESGSGKSVTFLSVLRLLASTGRITGGEILFDGKDLVRLSPGELKAVRGKSVSMIFQDPMSSLNPLIQAGKQVEEMITAHERGLSRAERRRRVLDLLHQVHIPEPEKRLRHYPHEFSGGMRQRVMIAMALACRPKLLIADEPTTALDVTIQDQIIRLLKQLQSDLDMSILFITHDLGVIAHLCTKVIVMYGGLVMEEAGIDDLFERPMHPYTRSLLASIPGLDRDRSLRLHPIAGSPPDMSHPPPGCPFAPRCPYAMRVCHLQQAPVIRLKGSRLSSCWLLAPGAPGEDNPLAGTEALDG